MRRCAGAILLRDGCVLLGRRSRHLDFYPNTWDIIGGHCEGSETPEETLVRELAEEIGVVPQVFTRCAVLSEPEPRLHGEAEYHVYVVTQWAGGEPAMLGGEHDEIRWFTLGEAMRLDLALPGYVPILASLGPNNPRQRQDHHDRMDR